MQPYTEGLTLSDTNFTLSAKNVGAMLEGRERAACNRLGASHTSVMSAYDAKRGRINLYEMLPEQGDILVVQNCGDHFSIQHYNVYATPPLFLTDEEIEKLRQGQIVWN